MLCILNSTTERYENIFEKAQNFSEKKKKNFSKGDRNSEVVI